MIPPKPTGDNTSLSYPCLLSRDTDGGIMRCKSMDSLVDAYGHEGVA